MYSYFYTSIATLLIFPFWFNAFDICLLVSIFIAMSSSVYIGAISVITATVFCLDESDQPAITVTATNSSATNHLQSVYNWKYITEVCPLVFISQYCFLVIGLLLLIADLGRCFYLLLKKFYHLNNFYFINYIHSSNHIISFIITTSFQ